MATSVPLACPDLSGNEEKYVLDCIRSGWVSSRGKYVEEFERILGEYFGSPALVCSSGTAALHLALLAAGVGRGHSVIVPNLTFAATASVVLAVGAKPILRDVDPETWTLPPHRIRPRYDTAAIIPVHLYGARADMEGIMNVAADRNITVIEDACEAFDIKPVADYACYSFFANKHITTGEGGAVVGNTDRVKLYRDGGQIGPYNHIVPGLNYRMTNMQAALGVAQMERLRWFLHGRTQCANWYHERVEGKGSWYFAAVVDNPVEAARRLSAGKIESRPVFVPLNKQRPFETSGRFPVSTLAHERYIIVPTGPHVSEIEVDRICRILVEQCGAMKARSGSSLGSTPAKQFPTTSSSSPSPSGPPSRSPSRP